MRTPAMPPLRTLLDARRGQIADRWHMALAPTSFVPYGWQEVRDRLVALVERVLEALCAEPPDRPGAQAVGADLARLHYRQPEALSVTQEALGAGIVAGLRPAQVVALQPRLTALLGGIAAGFLRQVQAQTLEEQEAIRAALLTQRRRAEEALRASEERFRAVFAEAAIGIGLADLEGRIVEINRAWEEMLGYDRGEMVGVRITDVLHPDEVPSAWVMYGEMMAGARPLYHAEQRHRRKDGRIVWCDLIVSIVHDAAGRPQFAVGMAEDITERKEAEATLAEQYRATEAARSETRAILDATGEAMLLVAPDGRILTTNQRFAEFFPVPQGLLLGHSFADVRPVFERIFGDPATVARLAGQLADTERRLTEDVTQRWPEHRELELSSTPVAGAEGTALGRLFAFRDVTRERQVDRMQSEFVALVSHELRTPLTSIKGYVDLLLAGDVGELEAEQREFLAVVRHNADRLAALIGDLLDVARIEAGQLALRPTALDIARVIREVAASFRPQVARKRQRLVVRAPGGLPAVWGDSERVTQILTNLVSNAHKYTPEGGQITVVAAAAGDGIRLEVRDTGVGLSPEEQARLFTRFYRAQNRATQEAGGTGLGLAITRALVEAHGGRIAVESSPGRGATFRLTLPTAPAGGEAPPPA
jgi:PAS domain S-box-containing protein